ncbi:hypothetical protein AAZX31_20G000900 [Glycine max]|uniref:F-box domain-containing protein n=2 Tax=Glycine subgen. Soja TaxID=1462606 RepID=K7N0I3_SOYBN|nr:FBD-associated F-box protein At4g10400 [Glycine max]XP_028221536.1 FBD-associated F-box protein At4g10400-like [Glycine soja]KAH1033857.1 hypothetical protein GYH30_054325 [Glycine max]KRG89101.1 hypothetical protein GLYMA_20G001100v4 [Glycine max]RZB41758.1 putative F-box/FBD/LRR-repeat protein [Glycine soja]|eukprot:XP_006605413.1 FBD-associated F-box protein At4g10400 [Glycine max]
MEEGKRKLAMKRKRESTGGGKDRLSELPDSVLVHIMELMETRNAVQTCVLSQRWKNLWRRMTRLSFNHPRTFSRYHNFVSHVLSGRDHSVSLIDLLFVVLHSTSATLLHDVISYAVSHNVQQLTIYIDTLDCINGATPSFQLSKTPFVPLLFPSPSLTSLKLSSVFIGYSLELPKSLLLPSLKTLHLTNVHFTASDHNNNFVEPFSTCHMLNTLVIQYCFMHTSAQVLSISNSNLSSLTLDTFQEHIVLSTPNLTSLTIRDGFHFTLLQLSSTCDLSLLKEADIETRVDIHYSVIITWLRLMTNVKMLTISSATLKAILNDLSDPAAATVQPPCFGRLESLKVKMHPHVNISKEEVSRTLEHLLVNSPPPTRVYLINVSLSHQELVRYA